jgi:hypothetical protein
MIGTMIHFGVGSPGLHLVGLDATRLDSEASQLFGSGAKAGLLQWLLPGDTLVLSNVHRVSCRARWRPGGAPQAGMQLPHGTCRLHTLTAATAPIVAHQRSPQFQVLCRPVPRRAS